MVTLLTAQRIIGGFRVLLCMIDSYQDLHSEATTFYALHSTHCSFEQTSGTPSCRAGHTLSLSLSLSLCLSFIFFSLSLSLPLSFSLGRCCRPLGQDVPNQNPLFLWLIRLAERPRAAERATGSAMSGFSWGGRPQTKKACPVLPGECLMLDGALLVFCSRFSHIGEGDRLAGCVRYFW